MSKLTHFSPDHQIVRRGSSCPALLGLPLHSRRIWVLHLEPVGRWRLSPTAVSPGREDLRDDVRERLRDKVRDMRAPLVARDCLAVDNTGGQMQAGQREAVSSREQLYFASLLDAAQE
jgi:hypothetical protein